MINLAPQHFAHAQSKVMYVNCRVVPWYSIDEYRCVLSKLRSSDINDLRDALVSIQIWLTRTSVSKIPRAITCTYELLLAKLEKSSQALAMAVMRFISLVSSEGQDRNRSGFAIPIYSLVPNAGLPPWMADLRNEIAHGVMPSISALEKAYEFAMSWLLDFWDANAMESSTEPDLSPLLNLDWSASISTVEEFLACPKREVAVTRAFAKHLVKLANNGLRVHISPELKAVLQLFLKFHKINNLIYAVYNLFPSRGAISWANAWLDAFKALSTSQEHYLLEFYSPSDFLAFPWRHCLEQVCLSSIPPSFDFTTFLEIFQPQLPDTVRASLIDIGSSHQSNAIATKAESIGFPVDWKLDRSIRWWRLPLGVIPTMSMIY